MESQPQNPEFRITPENFHPYKRLGDITTGLIRNKNFIKCNRIHKVSLW